MSDPRHLLGQRGESRVAAWLADRGWRVLDRRWRSSAGEIDLVCIDDRQTLVAVEVKLRSSRRAGFGAEGVDRRRIGRLRRTLAEYAAGHGLRLALRVDLVSLDREGDRWRLRHERAIDAW